MIATATITLWTAPFGSASAIAQTPAPQAAPAAGEAPPATPALPPVAPAAPPVAPVAPPQAQQQGTPATVLDTQDYESVLGKSVRSANGDELGRIIDLIIDKDGRPRAAIIDFGGFLGVGSRKIAVDWRALRFTSDGKVGRLSLQLSRNQVRVSPEYKAGEPIVVLGPASPGPEGEQATAPAAAPPTVTPTPAPSAAPAPPPAAAPAPKPADKPASEKVPDK
ncbi:PRC-barrel domain-containing protein [Methylobacterium cerastii]|nr:PRC-barrel domain-containing protein [Methylobacterium cerastii]